MARKVTRTISFTRFNTLIVSTLTNEVTTQPHDIPGIFKTEKEVNKLLSIVRKELETEEFKVAAITDPITITQLREMDESTFIYYSHPVVKTKNESEDN